MKEKLLRILLAVKGGNMTGIIITLGIIAGAVALGIGSSYYMGDDNALEERAEQVIEHQTGMIIDLSPSTLEE